MKNRLLRSFDFRFNRANLLKPSVLTLIIANIFLITGVIFWGWDIFLLFVLFWMENLVIGFFTVLKLLCISRHNAMWVGKITAAIFFCLHYGLFTLVHGMFVFVAFGGEVMSESSSSEVVAIYRQIVEYQLGWAALALFISHGVSFFFNYISAGEYRQSSLNDVMQQPYGRVVILHLAIIFGGLLVALFGSPTVGLVLLIVFKTVVDIRAHLIQHEKYSAPEAATH